MIVFLIANLKKKPYLSMSLNDLETISLLTSSLSIYCGIFFITDIPYKDIPLLPGKPAVSAISWEALILRNAYLWAIGLFWYYRPHYKGRRNDNARTDHARPGADQ
jgi:hypothetical protein